MTPIILPIAELKPALAGLAKVINRQSPIPIASSIKIERTNEGWITLTGTDFHHFVTVRLEQPTDGDAIKVVIPYDQLLKTLSKCSKDGSIFVRTSEIASNMSATIQYPIGQQFAEDSCESFPARDFPSTPRVKGESIPVNEHLRQSIREALNCASEDPTREVINGIFLDVSDPKCHQIIGTDGSHLYASNSFSLPLKNSILVPKHRFLEWTGFNSDGEWKLNVGSDGSDMKKQLLQLSSRRWRFISSLSESTFPNWRQAIPEEFKTTVRLDGDSLASAVHAINRLPFDLKHTQKLVCLCVDHRKLLLQSKSNNDDNWVIEEISGASIQGQPVTITLNRDHLLKALKFGLRQIEIQDSQSPVLFSDGGKQMIVVPARTIQQVPSAPTEQNKPSLGKDTVQVTEDHPPREDDPPVPALEAAMQELETVKDALKENLTRVVSIQNRIKLAQREQKVRKREFQSIRSTLKSLQNVRI